MLTTREQRRRLERENRKRPTTLQEVPRHEWPNPNAPQVRVLRSRDFLVQVFDEPLPVLVRLSISRTTHNGERWEDGITWDELQRVKREAGYGNMDAVEVFPSDQDVVNVANMRHLFVMAEAIGYAWRHGLEYCGVTVK